jgi:hypothetical protein
MSSGVLGSASGLYRANSNILQYLFNWDYIARNYWFELIIQTVINVLDSIQHVFGHPAVALGPPRAYIGWIGIFCGIYSIGVTLQWNIQSNSLFRLSSMFSAASDMSSGVLGSASGLLGPISGGFKYFTVFIQLGLHCNVIFIRINYSDCHWDYHKCFGHHLTCRQASCGCPRAYIGQIGIFCDIYSIRVTFQCNIQSNALFGLS